MSLLFPDVLPIISRCFPHLCTLTLQGLDRPTWVYFFLCFFSVFKMLYPVFLLVCMYSEWKGCPKIESLTPLKQINRVYSHLSAVRKWRNFKNIWKSLKYLTRSHVTPTRWQTTLTIHVQHLLLLMSTYFREVKTEYMFILDADFVPSPDFEEKFFQTMKRVERKDPKIVYVVPVFEGN